MTVRLWTCAALALCAVVGSSCSSPYEGERASARLPSPENFDSVAVTLEAHCGSLDCHGQPGRNFRLYGYSGRRLDPKDVPGGLPTTPKESGVDYCSAAELEPELTAQVLAEHGARPERLTLVRKARGSERHVGGSVFPKDSLGDQCLVAWLSGGAQPFLCNNSLTDDPAHRPPPAKQGAVDLSACNGEGAQR
jgi:hypothetical protein